MVTSELIRYEPREDIYHQKFSERAVHKPRKGIISTCNAHSFLNLSVSGKLKRRVTPLRNNQGIHVS